tara:strand:+ start:269 stop:469 length:201 start_codon:yes stop_codon:yes gene_type:complete
MINNNFLGIIQYEMEAKYQAKSELTDLFIQNKFWGWLGLFTIFFAICAIGIFQVRSWDEEDNDQNR